MPAEEDTQGLIDGVVAVEPNTAMGAVDFSIKQGDQTWGPESVGWSLYDYFALGGVFMPCATADFATDMDPEAPRHYRYRRCMDLKERGFLTSPDDANLPAEAAQKLIDNGFLPESIDLITNLENFYPRITANYSNSYGRYRLSDDLCQVTFVDTSDTTINVGNFDGIATDAEIMNKYVGENIVLDPLNLRDYEDNMFGLDKDLCFYALSIYGRSELKAAKLYNTYKHDNKAYKRVQRGLKKTIMSGNLQGIPAILIQGRSDQVVAPNHGARAYYAKNRQVENRNDVVYWEVENGHHLEMFQHFYNIGIFGASTEITYLNPYFHEAMDQMFDYLANGTAIAPSQVIRTVPGTPTTDPDGNPTGTPITADMFGPVQDEPGADAITWADNTLTIPE
jgi:hydroxybutyrate-dimer hydrolase